MTKVKVKTSEKNESFWVADTKNIVTTQFYQV